MFNSVEAVIAAFSLGNAKFKCRVCGKNHFIRGRGWENCIKSITGGRLMYGKYTIMSKHGTRIRVPIVDFCKPLPYYWTVLTHPKDINLLNNEYRKLSGKEEELTGLKENLIKMSVLSQKLLPLEIILEDDIILNYINSLAESDIFLDYLDVIRACVSVLNKIYDNYKHLFTINPPDSPIEIDMQENIRIDGKTISQNDISEMISNEMRVSRFPITNSEVILTKDNIVIKKYGNKEIYPYSVFLKDENNCPQVIISGCGPKSFFAEKIKEVLRPYIKTYTTLKISYF